MAQDVVVGTGGGNKDVPTIFVGTAGGNKRIIAGFVGTAGGNKQFFTILTLDVSPAAASASGTTTTNTVTATTTFGAGSDTFLWTFVSGDATIAVSNSTAQTVSFNIPSVDNKTGVWKVTVTDAHGTTDSVNVSITFDDGL